MELLLPFSLEQMSFYKLDPSAPAQFSAAALSLSEPLLRAELITSQIPAPEKIAPWALAFAAQAPNPADTPMNRGVGRIVFLHDPEQFDTWGSNMRVIAYGKSPLESDLGIEEDVAHFWWEELIRALKNHGVQYSHEAGTVTKMTSTGMGSLANDPTASEVEIRASWSPQQDDLGPHLAAWQDLIAAMAGFGIDGEGVTRLTNSK
jgi:hypothetical protein